MNSRKVAVRLRSAGKAGDTIGMFRKNGDVSTLAEPPANTMARLCDASSVTSGSIGV